MIRFSLFFLVALAACLNPAPANPTVGKNARVVAMDGSDGNPGSLAAPYKTIQKCASSVPSGWTCLIRAGVYRETVIPNSGIRLEPYNNESVTVDGSDPVTGWTPYNGKIYKANVALNPGLLANQVFVNGAMMTMARWPNGGDDPLRPTWATLVAGTGVQTLVDPNLPNLDWKGANVRLYSGSDPFSHQTATVTSAATGRLEIALDTASTCPAICPVEKGWYYLEGALVALDTAKEWFYDAASKTLYLQAPGGANPNSLNVTVKARNHAFDLRGKSNVTVKGVRIFGATVITDQKSSNNTLDGLHADYISHFNTLEGDGFAISNSHSAETGIIFDGSGNTLKNSEIAHSAGNGVTLLGQGNTVSNNLIHDVDDMGSYASGIVVYTSHQTITHNTIYNAGRAGITLSGSVSTGHDIGYNNIYATNLFSSDGGLIYACCNQDGTGTRVHHNWLHSSSGVATTTPPSSCCRDPQGFYIDNGSHHFEVSQNVIWDIGQGQAVFLHGDTKTSQYNLVHNNTVPDNRAALMIGDAPDATGSRIENNRLRAGLVVILINPAANLVEQNNGPTAPGATEMGAGVKVGCDFAGCESGAPPTF